MKILFFTQYFWPENFRINELVDFLSKKKSVILTGYPSYPQKKNFDKNNYLKKIFLSKKCEIKRVPVYLRNNTNLSIIFNYISFFFSSLTIGFFKIFKENFDIIFVFCPSPILNAIPAIIFKKIFKKKIVIWVLDLWPDTVVDLKLVNNKRWKLFDLEYQSISILDIEKIGYDSKIKRQGIKKLVDKMLSKS